MKILVVFADMIGGDYLNVINSNAQYTDLDRLFTAIGGTVYSNCYTPAPDTPRSSACMWSGCYPKKNGCDNRLKYPGKFLRIGNLWNSLKDVGYSFNVYMRETDARIGTLPKGFEQYAKYEPLKDYIRKIQFVNNSLSFFYFHDLHSYLDNNGYNTRTLKKGTSILASLMDDIFSAAPPDTFDYILFFSDHGFRYDDCKSRHLIENDRVKTTMFLRKRGDASLKIDASLRSNLDVYPTIMEMAGLDYSNDIDGKSLFGKGHNAVYVEDHDDFSVRLSQSVEHWAVVTDSNKYWLECSGKWEMENRDELFDEDYYRKEIIDKMDDYEMNSTLWRAMHIYDDNKLIDNRYSNGSIITKPFYRKKWIIGIRIIIRKVIKLFF